MGSPFEMHDFCGMIQNDYDCNDTGQRNQHMYLCTIMHIPHDLPV